ncbi:hypothetical protein C8Q70DRAFT_1054696 [Cubamyces menziesii]|uniref:Uncharacterized protein n=1 Tax=Trametes cubensis TaxID=1111947 RepID=A0AAD7TJ67_9APHY|nr:hypothetical protein C8Q70DRAFT_1054696 [Cubamyces menziesii]KAJ8462942.1 hypothetical protein ONZ51_g10581 [Trametes cubensis]
MSPDSRPLTPDSQLTSSLHRATTTIDELTHTLTSVSRLSSPDPEDVCTCCCRKEECETSKAWAAVKSKLESRLLLSAEVGRALLERHEALVRRQESPQVCSSGNDDTLPPESPVDARVAELLKQNALLEKRLAQALVHTEVCETSKKSVLQELEAARTDLARLSAQSARSIGLEQRLAAALQEKDDLHQELDSATQRARMAEMRIVSYRDKCAKLQAQVARLRDEVESQKVHRHELSEEILSEARQRLEQLQYHQLGHAASNQDAEVTKVLETLVADNEALKRDNAELQNLLSASREDLRSLQEELDERRASDTPFSRKHRPTDSGHSFTLREPRTPLSPTFHVGTAPNTSVLHSKLGEDSSRRRSQSTERSTRHTFEPMTPETDRRPWSPADSHIPAGNKWTSFAHPRASYAPSQLSSEMEENEGASGSPERPRAQKTLFLLTRSRGVQTDIPWNGPSALSPSPVPRGFADHMSSPHDGRSESSSLTDGQSSVIGALLDRTTQLFNRITQADALTLTNRLKRQHLLGADVSHLSRTTVNAILGEVTALRSHFRPFLEDDKITTTCTRRDLRGLLKLIKDVFTELGELRVTLNDVILDPTIAGKVSEMAMNLSKAQVADAAGARDGPSNASAPSWITPISKLLGLPNSGAGSSESSASRALSPPGRTIGRGRPPARIVPKREAALSASAMTVNVEFSGAAVGRAVTSTYSAHPSRGGDFSSLTTPSTSTNTPAVAQPEPRRDVSRSVMDIFAGAPRPMENDPWVVLPRVQTVHRMASMAAMNQNSTTIGRSTLRHATSGRRLSRIVDAVIDSPQIGGEHSEAEDDSTGPPSSLDRALRRGLSDSSIHTTFTQHGEESQQDPGAIAEPPQRPDRESVLQALSRKMQSFRFASHSAAATGTNAHARGSSISRPQTPVPRTDAKNHETNSTPRQSPPRPIPQAKSTLFGISAWTAAYEASEATDPGAGSYYAASPREEAFVQRGWARERDI